MILQTLVYKMVPDLFKQEMQQRRDFYDGKPYAGEFLTHFAMPTVTMLSIFLSYRRLI